MKDHPRADRPQMPPAYGVISEPDGMLEWADVSRLIDAAEIYWVATASPDGAPHLVPLHAAAVAGRIYLSGDPDSRWVRNIGADPRLQVSIDRDDHQVVVRGEGAHRVPDPGLWEAIRANIASKYNWQHGEEPMEMLVVVPRRVLAFDLSGEGSFQTSPTRFTFEEAE